MTFRAAKDPVKRIEILTEDINRLRAYAEEAEENRQPHLAGLYRRMAAGKKAAITRLGRQL